MTSSSCLSSSFIIFSWFLREKLSQQTVGIPMGTNCAPIVADIFTVFALNGKDTVSISIQSHRYIDDVLSINNPEFEYYLDRMYPAELEIKDTKRISLLLLTYIYYCLFTTNEMISITTSQIFRSWVVIYHLCRPVAFLSLSLYDTPGFAPRMNVLFWGQGNFPVIYWNMDTSWNAWNRPSGSFMVDTGILFNNMTSSSHERWTTFWPLTSYSEIPTNQTFNQFHDLDTELDLHRITSGFHGAFATGVACQQGTLTLPDTWFRPAFWDFLILKLLRPVFSNLSLLFSTFHLEYPSVLYRFSFDLKFNRIHLTKVILKVLVIIDKASSRYL